MFLNRGALKFCKIYVLTRTGASSECHIAYKLSAESSSWVSCQCVSRWCRSSLHLTERAAAHIYTLQAIRVTVKGKQPFGNLINRLANSDDPRLLLRLSYTVILCLCPWIREKLNS